MNINDITKLSAKILNQYYNNDIQPFFNNCHEDVLWLGPAVEHMIVKKENLIKAFKEENNPLHFKVYDLTATPFYISSNCVEVLLRFIVDTFWPDGRTNRVYQRITLTWSIKKGIPLIKVCHISNAIDYNNKDSIYPVHYLDNHTHMTLYMESFEKLYFNGVNKSILYTIPEQIIYMESSGNHTLIHLTSQTFESIERLSTIHKRISDKFIRCHSSYLINPIHVNSIERFSLTMTNGTKIPVPEKKYTTIKKILLKK